MIHDDHIHLRAHIKPPRPHEIAGIKRIAEERGIKPGIREHPPLPVAYRLGEFKDFDYGMIIDEVDRFISLFEGSGIAMGLEADFFPGYEDELAKIIDDMLASARSRGVEISGVNGSVHLLPGDLDDLGVDKGDVMDIVWDLSEDIFVQHVKQWTAARMMDDYFTRMVQLVKTGLYDTLSHLEVIRKFDRIGPDGKSIYFGELEEQYFERAAEVLEEVAKTEMAVEINTSGVNNLLGRPYISQALLDICAKLGIPVAVGSDSHLPEGLGAHFDIAYDMCRRAGIKKLVTFQNREKIFYGF